MGADSLLSRPRKSAQQVFNARKRGRRRRKKKKKKKKKEKKKKKKRRRRTKEEETKKKRRRRKRRVGINIEGDPNSIMIKKICCVRHLFYIFFPHRSSPDICNIVLFFPRT